MFTTVVKLRQVVFEVSVSFPNEEVSCDEGKGITNRTATAPPKIIRDITRGISRFTIRALFCAEVRLWLLFILAVASDSISFWWLSNSNEVFTSFGSKVSRNWELLASMWFRNGSDELLLIQLARIKSEKKKTIHKLCALFVPSSCFKGGGHPYRNDGRPLSTRNGTQSTYCIRWKVWGCLICEGRGVTPKDGEDRRFFPRSFWEGNHASSHTFYETILQRSHNLNIFNHEIVIRGIRGNFSWVLSASSYMWWCLEYD